MNHDEAPLLDGIGHGRRRHKTGFGAPGHHLGAGAPADVRRALGPALFRADLATPKGVDDRTETEQTVQRAHALGADAWGGEFCRYTSGGSTQSLHILLAAVAGSGGRVLLPHNAHKAEWSAGVLGLIDPVPLPAAVDPVWDVEHGVEPDTLDRALAAMPGARAALVVSPTYFGAVSDIAGLARVAHAHGVPLIVDAAWGAAFPFSTALPANPMTLGADAMVVSVHKTMGALGGGSALIARGGLIDLERLLLAYELFLTTSPSVPVLASVDGARRDGMRHGEKAWADAVELAETLRERLRAVDGVRVLGAELIGRPGVHGLDPTKVTLDVSGLGVSGYAADDWLARERKVSMGLSDGRLLNAVIGVGTTTRDTARMVSGLEALARHVRRHPGKLAKPPAHAPALDELSIELVMPPPAAFAGKARKVRWEDAAGETAAETIAPAPPGIPRLLPGQRITPAHVRWLVANRQAGMFVLDPAEPTQHGLRVVA